MSSRRAGYRIRCASTALLVYLSGTSACDDPSGPAADEVSGSYVAIAFTTRQGGVDTDQLALGASISLTLRPDGTTGGRLFVPGGNPDGSDFEADLGGTWTLNDRTVDLTHDVDTFLNDLAFSFESDTLSGEERFSGITVRVELAKQ